MGGDRPCKSMNLKFKTRLNYVPLIKVRTVVVSVGGGGTEKRHKVAFEGTKIFYILIWVGFTGCVYLDDGCTSLHACYTLIKKFT